MTLTALDPVTALVVVDLQAGVTGRETAHPIPDVLAANRLLLDAFRAKGLPVVLVNVDAGAPGRTDLRPEGGSFAMPPEATEFAPELDRQPSDHVVTKKTWGSFTGTDLDEWLRAQGATEVVVTGVATTAGVESTARHAHELGYHVVLATDAMTDMSPAGHDYAVSSVFPRIGQSATAAEIVALLP
ncbi:cysteine hydrolase [Frondihabitans australicus]|uniref:Nicotinamidase-related amidase n=1 Tax=Frondihabitans australicus TaxID=386892 RepID=A0A495ID46_9MICO|nr:cysteine hydrolase [Frondihabitans australicus]RKR73231.1 nicotinamidase-related amidase [Frondihabitans australicus]